MVNRPIDFQTKHVRQFRNPPEGEQDLVRAFFGGRTEGYYVDVGANHPTWESQTWHLDQLGWQGVLVEPQPDLCELLRRERRGTVVQCACSSPQASGTQVPLLLAGGHSTLNSVPIAVGTETQRSVLVECRTLDDVLTQAGAPPRFDFLSVDIEGHEMEMFRGFTLADWAPALVLLEDHVIDHRKHDHMVHHGYQLILRTGLNSWYVPLAQAYRLSLGARLEYLRKYWLALPLRRQRFKRNLLG